MELPFSLHVALRTGTEFGAIAFPQLENNPNIRKIYAAGGWLPTVSECYSDKCYAEDNVEIRRENH